jgi:hypothetical protein
MAHIVIPPQAIIIGMPMFIMVIIRSQHSMNMSFMESSIGVISHFMPVGVMVQVILHIIIAIGIILFIIDIGIMEPIMGMGIMVGIGIAAVMAGSVALSWLTGALRVLLDAINFGSRLSCVFVR